MGNSASEPVASEQASVFSLSDELQGAYVPVILRSALFQGSEPRVAH